MSVTQADYDGLNRAIMRALEKERAALAQNAHKRIRYVARLNLAGKVHVINNQDFEVFAQNVLNYHRQFPTVPVSLYSFQEA